MVGVNGEELDPDGEPAPEDEPPVGEEDSEQPRPAAAPPDGGSTLGIEVMPGAEGHSIAEELSHWLSHWLGHYPDYPE